MIRTAIVEVDEGERIQCFAPKDLAVREGDHCIVDMERYQEIGQIVAIQEGVERGANEKKLPGIARRVTLQDQAKADDNAVRAKIALKTCNDTAQQCKLDIRVIKVRYSFDRSVLFVLFNAEERVDFREMVKMLSSELRARVEMKQVGVRDEAGMIGGLGPCGRNLCCCTWLTDFESINVRMAKCQRLSLNPSAISGMCGRLKCCLRYEHDQYREADKNLPSDGSTVHTPDGSGRVIDKNIMAGKVTVRLEDERVMVYDVKDLKKGGG